KHIYAILLCLVAATALHAQVTLTSSNLPIVVINTGGATIPDEPKINATMGIVYNGDSVRNNVTDPFNEYNGNIGIEVRGQSSQGFPMKSYSIELRDQNGDDQDKSIFGLPEESDWVLYAPYTDKTLMHNVLAYKFSNAFGQWAAHTKFVEVMLNGEYIGIYVFMEKIKRDKGRVDIKKLEGGDTTASKITGGYIYSIDKNADAWYSPYRTLNVGNYIHYKWEYPKAEDITEGQKAYIQSFSDSFETALKSDNFQDPQTGFRNFADEASFIDYFIINEVSRNVDGYRISTYLHKDRNDVNRKIIAGPVWDYDIAFHNADYCNGSLSTGWAFRFNSVCNDTYTIPFWWNRFMQDTAFEAHLRCRWQELRKTTLSFANINRLIDSVVNVTAEARERHFAKWPVLGVYVWPNPYPIPRTYAGEIKTLKQWLYDRITWLDQNMPHIGACSGASAPPVQLISLSGTRSNGINNLVWKAVNEENLDGYEVQYSTDGKQYAKVGYVAANDKYGGNYTFTHSVTGNSSAMYRIVVVSSDGTSKASNTIQVSSLSKAGFAISPNPGRGQFVISGSNASGITMKVVSPDGKLLCTSKGNVTSLSATLNNLLQGRSAGLYTVQLTDDTSAQSIKLLLQ
ncbi:MAG: CotH kinase family protein, partial [Williamsia sp.]|nr:CotH kinase family protein [Williamsia sp.]